MRIIYQARDLTIVGAMTRRYIFHKHGPELYCPADSYLLYYILPHVDFSSSLPAITVPECPLGEELDEVKMLVSGGQPRWGWLLSHGRLSSMLPDHGVDRLWTRDRGVVAHDPTSQTSTGLLQCNVWAGVAAKSKQRGS